MNDELTIKKQLKRSIPMAFEGLINTLMTLVDTLVISTIGINELGAIGAMSVIINIMQMSIQTINVSNNTLVAKSIGENNVNKIKSYTGNAIIMALIVSIITIGIILMIQPFFPAIFRVDKICIVYLTIRLLGFIQDSIVIILSGHQRTIGNQGNILKLRIFAVLINLILDIIVVNYGYGIKEVASITVLIDTILFLYLIIKSKDSVQYKYKKEYFYDIFKLFKWNFVERIASKVDNFIFNIIVSRMGSMQYAVHVILIQIANIYEAFIQRFGDGITISVGIAIGKNTKDSIQNVKMIAKKIITICSYLFPIFILIISIIVMNISLKELELQIIFYQVLPIVLIGTYVTMSATYYFSILRGFRDFKFLAKRNMISSIIKILLAFILGYTPLGIIGVWMSYLFYGVVQKYLSKQRYYNLLEQ